MDQQAVATLLTPEGWALLESLPPYDEHGAMALGEQLRRAGHAPELVSAALTQSRLRAAGERKFGPFAAGMLFTPAGLEQATRLPVAARHAARFATAGATRVADLGCGIGGDAMALAGLELGVLAVERDELTAAVATVNLRHWAEAEVRHGDATTTDLGDLQAAFLDPARRTSSGKRLLDPRAGSPPLSFALELAATMAAVGVKTAPGIPHHLLPDGCEAQWISVDGDVVEAGLWFGLAARPGVRRCALVLSDAGAAEVTDADMPVAVPGEVGAYVYEPDGAVIRAGLVAQVAVQVQGRLLDRSIAFVTADRYVETPLATCFAVEEVFPFGLKSLRTWLRDRGVGRLTIKKRGTAVDPDQLRKQLRLQGDNEATIILTRVSGRQSVLVVRPLRRAGAGVPA
ncbi:SAM-dependent methyltransferase [Spongisporangium articulatum]|uniref:SAM-dependent methyltransferase n=1 Tax=Spongisporangium articulatum TaxID=3362603 RepID=A0ABW8APX4_9ACTN